MRSADAHRLLADARSTDALVALLRALGVRGPATPASRGTAAALFATGVRDPHIVDGAGPLRVFVGECDGRAALRDVATTVARWLTSAAPAMRWLVALARSDGAECALAACIDGTPRIVALIVDPRRVRGSDAESLCALAAAGDDGGARPIDGAALHDRWYTLLGRDALSRRFYRRLERAVHGLAASATSGTADVRAELALLCVSRLLFLAFLEAKGWLDADHRFLRRGFDACAATGGRYHDRVLRPLFFGTLNAPWKARAAAARAFGRVPFLNGGLFAPSPTERRHRGLRFGDDALATVIVDLLGTHRFTPREDDAALSDSAVDPEMLGHAFESLMGAATRRSTGAFYTPQRLVAHVTREGLRAALGTAADGDAIDALLGGVSPSGAMGDVMRARLGALRVIDPACGSGAFVVHALERMASLLIACGDARPVADVRRDVLARSIFGVDVNPTAVWLCELRLWLSVVVESDVTDPMRVAPLPNLDHQIRVGDALAAAPWTRGWGGDPWALGDGAPRVASRTAALDALRARYGRATGRRKLALGAALDRLERAAAITAVERALAARRAERADLLAAARGRDLFGGRRGSDASERRRLVALRDTCRALVARRAALERGGALPFGFAWHFPALAARRGVDLVLGNPPWVRPHALGVGARQSLRATYETCRDAAWVPGATAARAGRGFGSQADLAAPFVERALALTRPGGAIALLVPAKLWRSLAGGGVRRVLLRESHVRAIDDWSDAPALFDAAVYPTLGIRIHHAEHVDAWTSDVASLPLDDSSGAPWLLVPPDVRATLGALQRAGVPLGTSGLGRIQLGVKCGCNDAFVVRVVRASGDVAHVDGVWPDGSARHGRIERALLRPVLRGETLHDTACDEHVIWPYDARDRPLRALPSEAAAWFAPWRARLGARSDARALGVPWWALFRTAAAASDAPRIVWADVATALRPRLLAAGDPTVPLNSCYVLRCAEEDAAALCALLASPVADAWCRALAEPARGGFRRHLAWTIALMPVPRDWARARAFVARGDLARAYGVDGIVSAAYVSASRAGRDRSADRAAPT